MSDGPLPPDWEATTDPSSGNTYYYNTKTNAVSWERPRGGAVTLGGSAEALGASGACCSGTVRSSLALHTRSRSARLEPRSR